MKPCECCATQRDYPGVTDTQCPTCLYCGARGIQRIMQLQVSREKKSEWAKAVLNRWVQFGHDEAEIRRLVKGPLAVAPKSGKK